MYEVDVNVNKRDQLKLVRKVGFTDRNKIVNMFVEKKESMYVYMCEGIRNIIFFALKSKWFPAASLNSFSPAKSVQLGVETNYCLK